MKALLIGDVHLADRPPSLRSKDYADQILAKLSWCVEEAHRREADVIIVLGDLFHIKTPSRTSHRLVQKAHDALTAAGIPVIVVPGNHDVVNDRMASLAGQPLGALGRMEGVELLMGPHEAFPVYGIPWLADWQELPGELEKYRTWADQKFLGSEEWPLLITHAPIFPPGENPPYDFIDAADWAEMMQKGTCAYGHIHDPHGYYHPVPGVPVGLVNYGAISRGSLAEATLARKPQVGWYDSTLPTPEKVTPIDVPHLPVEQVFDMVTHQMVKAETRRMTDFLTGLEGQTFLAASSEDLAEELKKMEIEPAVREAAVELLEWARA